MCLKCEVTLSVCANKEKNTRTIPYKLLVLPLSDKQAIIARGLVCLRLGMACSLGNVEKLENVHANSNVY